MKKVVILLLLFGSAAYAADPLAPTPMDPTDALQAMHDDDVSAIHDRSDLQNQISSGVSQGAQWAGLGISVAGAAHELLDAYTALTHLDANCMDLGNAGAPPVPTGCLDSAACGECYTSAQRRLDGMRINLERLRCVYTTAATFAKKAMAFGDSASGIHAVTGLEWQTQKAGIQQELTNLQHSYDVKLGQMLPNLRSSLEALGECEARYFHTSDWFQRFGFIYYTFMADRYKRND
ncbi:MAG TPA: hypothetical protein VIV40_22815 [Kofleriaceae bacterium]